MRYKLSENSLHLLFSTLESCGFVIDLLGQELKKHPRTIRDWRRGKFSIDENSLSKLISLAQISIDHLSFTIVNDVQRKREAGKKGGRERYKKYGNFGTLKDKKQGGTNTYKKLKNNRHSIYARNKIRKPKESIQLAEFIGTCMGDGSITDYQLAISLNSEDDRKYIAYVFRCGEELFGLKPRLIAKKGANCTNIVFNGIELVEFLVSVGLPKGDKIRAGLCIPEWILVDRENVKACVRGLFDTDGSIFLETHKIQGKKYSYPRMALVSASESLREQVCDALLGFGISAKIRNDRNVTIERFTDIEKYFRIIGSSNQKHLDRFAKYGGVA